MFQTAGRISPDAVTDFQTDSASKRPETQDVLSLGARRWRQRRTRRQAQSLLLMLLFLAFFVYVFIIRPQKILEQQQNNEEQQRQSLFFHRRSSAASPTKQRFLIFLPFGPGQGTGNIMHGLLAVHLLGMEFNRTVCVSPNYTEFHLAFESTSQKDCEESLVEARRQHDDDDDVEPNDNNTISIITYRPPPPNEFSLQQQLASDTNILYFFGNTYPRWPSGADRIPKHLFQQHYQPTTALQQYLPIVLPKSVVHLRAGDSRRDVRRGVDEPTFHALGRYFQNTATKTAYLVMNRVKFYDWFASHYNWQHPSWNRVRHSAYKSYLWDRDNRQQRNITPTVAQNQQQQDDESIQQTLQLFSDWYVILNAKFVLHTHSDFSLSAIHWNNVDSKTIDGVDRHSGELLLSDEYWRTNDEEGNIGMKSLVDRTEDELLQTTKR